MTIEVLLTGSFGVGKSSIFNRFIHNDFSNKYYGTMGVRVSEKEMEDGTTVKLWDIAGEIHQNKVPRVYFLKKEVILYIIDLTRPFTFSNVLGDIQYLKENASESIIKVIGNKNDLLSEEELELRKKDIPVAIEIVTSAKTGENIEVLFSKLVEEALKNEKNT